MSLGSELGLCPFGFEGPRARDCVGYPRPLWSRASLGRAVGTKVASSVTMVALAAVDKVGGGNGGI